MENAIMPASNCAGLGVSVVVCCHNSAERLPETLSCIAGQHLEDQVPWEVIVVDNASTDDTTRVAQDSWPKNSTIPLRVFHEPQLGLSYARQRGLTEARYGIVSFVDDDNWVCPEWVKTAAEIMSQHPEIGACGGSNEAVCEVVPPFWFKNYQTIYGIGPQGQETGDVTTTRGLLYGAGLTIRRSAWSHLVSNGFRPQLVGRTGAMLLAGEDAELCLALRLAGWRLWYEPRLRLSHFLPVHRLKWDYLRRLYRGSGASSIGNIPYYFAMKQKRTGLINYLRQLRESWLWQVLVVLIRLLSYPWKLFILFYSKSEGDPDVIYLEVRIGQLLGLMQRRKTYYLLVNEVRRAGWIAS